MKVLAQRAWLVFTATLVGCSGGGSNVTRPGVVVVPLPGASASPSAAPSAAMPAGTARVTLSFLLGSPGTAASRQKRSYISSKTKSVGIYVTSVNGGPPVPMIAATIANVGTGAKDCTTTNATITCTLAVAVPAGKVGLNIRTFPTMLAQGPPLSIGNVVVAVVPNQIVDAPVALLPVVAVAIIATTPSSIPGNQPGIVTLNVSAKDYAGDVIGGTDPYYIPITISTTDTTGHVVASPAFPATITAPGQTITLTYDGKGSAGFFVYNFGVASDSIVDGVAPVAGAVTLVQNGEFVYVSSLDSNAVYVYPAGPAQSNIALRVLSGPNTTIAKPIAVAVDKNGALYVVNYHRDITVFAPGANGNVAPIFTFATGTAHPESILLVGGLNPVVTGPATETDGTTTRVLFYDNIYDPAPLGGGFQSAEPTLSGVNSVAISPVDGQMCVQQTPLYSNPTTICDDVPVDGHNYGIAQNVSYGIAFRSDGLLVASQMTGYLKPFPSMSIYTLPARTPGYTTFLTPTYMLMGSTTNLSNPYQIAFDKAGNMYVANAGQGSGDGRVTIFAPTATGDTPPLRTIGGFNTSTGVAVGL